MSGEPMGRAGRSSNIIKVTAVVEHQHEMILGVLHLTLYV